MIHFNWVEPSETGIIFPVIEFWSTQLTAHTFGQLYVRLDSQTFRISNPFVPWFRSEAPHFAEFTWEVSMPEIWPENWLIAYLSPTQAMVNLTKLLGITYLVCKIKFELSFYGPKWLSKFIFDTFLFTSKPGTLMRPFAIFPSLLVVDFCGRRARAMPPGWSIHLQQLCQWLVLTKQMEKIWKNYAAPVDV